MTQENYDENIIQSFEAEDTTSRPTLRPKPAKSENNTQKLKVAGDSNERVNDFRSSYLFLLNIPRTLRKY